MKKIVLMTGLACFLCGAYAQTEKAVDGRNIELLVFIMPDSLELAPALKKGSNVLQSDIKSQRLKTTLASVKTASIAKAFPDWQEADSIVYTKSGDRVKNRSFTVYLSFRMHRNGMPTKLSKN